MVQFFHITPKNDRASPNVKTPQTRMKAHTLQHNKDCVVLTRFNSLFFTSAHHCQTCHKNVMTFFRIQPQFGATWSTSFGQLTGTQRSLSLSDGETVTRVRFWADHEAVYRIEVTTSTGTVYGPWGRNKGSTFDLQVRPSLYILGNQLHQFCTQGKLLTGH